MTALSYSVVIPKSPAIRLSSGSLKSADHSVGPINLAFGYKGTRGSSARRRAVTIQASYSDGARPSCASIFIGGFVLGGLIGGTLGCVYAPQISKALIGNDKKDPVKKLPKFIYDEEKALEEKRRNVTDKIKELNL